MRKPGSSLLCAAAVVPDRLPTVCVSSESLSKPIKNENTFVNSVQEIS